MCFVDCQAGEQSGTLGQMLTQLADHQEQILNLQTKIIKTLFYPLTILVVAMLITSGLLIFVVPQFENIFKNFNAQLPLFTQIVIKIAHEMRRYGAIICICFFSMGMLYHKFGKDWQKWQAYKDHLLLQLPWLANLFLKAIFSRWSRVLATLLAAGLPLLSALQISLPTIDNKFFQNSLLMIIKQVNDGQAFSSALQNNPLFPYYIVQMIIVGEHSGQMTTMLYNIAENQQIALDKSIDYFSKWLEPMMMLLIAIFTAALIIAMYLPVFNLGGTI